MEKNKKLILLALFMAIQIALDAFYIPVGTNLRIQFTFLVAMLVASIYSYPYVLIYAILEDLIAFFLFPSGVFFPGYTLTAVVSLSIYHFFLYKKIKPLNIAISKLLVNLIANVLINCIWSMMLFDKAYLYFVSKSIVKNIILLPIEIALFIIFFKLIKPLLLKYNLIKMDETSL